MSGIPEGYSSVTPYLVVEDAAAVLDFVKAAFGAEETVRMPGPDGKIAHAEFRIGDSVVMTGSNPDQLMPGMIYLYVSDTDGTYARAVAAGGVSVEEPNDTFYGDRRAAVTDPGGNHWFIATSLGLSDEEVQRRIKEQSAG